MLQELLSLLFTVPFLVPLAFLLPKCVCCGKPCNNWCVSFPDTVTVHIPSSMFSGTGTYYQCASIATLLAGDFVLNRVASTYDIPGTCGGSSPTVTPECPAYTYFLENACELVDATLGKPNVMADLMIVARLENGVNATDDKWIVSIYLASDCFGTILTRYGAGVSFRYTTDDYARGQTCDGTNTLNVANHDLSARTNCFNSFDSNADCGSESDIANADNSKTITLTV